MATFKIKKNKETVEVEVTVLSPPKGLRNRNKQSVTRRDVMRHLSASGVEVGSCLKETTVSNMGDNPQTSGTFIFASKDAPNPPPQSEVVRQFEKPKSESNDFVGHDEVTRVSRNVRKIPRKRKQVKSEDSTKE